jgi:hypothetical protein
MRVQISRRPRGAYLLGVEPSQSNRRRDGETLWRLDGLPNTDIKAGVCYPKGPHRSVSTGQLGTVVRYFFGLCFAITRGAIFL